MCCCVPQLCSVNREAVCNSNQKEEAPLSGLLQENYSHHIHTTNNSHLLLCPTAITFYKKLYMDDDRDNRAVRRHLMDTSTRVEWEGTWLGLGTVHIAREKRASIFFEIVIPCANEILLGVHCTQTWGLSICPPTTRITCPMKDILCWSLKSFEDGKIREAAFHRQ